MADPRKCHNLSGILAAVPYYNESGELIKKAQAVCLEHACEVAAYRFASTLPQHQFSQEEFEFMTVAGANGKALAVELKALGMFEPGDEDEEISE